MASAAALSSEPIADPPTVVDNGFDNSFPFRPQAMAKPQPADCKSSEPPVAVHPSRLLPYDPSSKEHGVQDLLSIYCNFITTTWPGRTYHVPLRTFLQEVLKRSRSSYPVFQLTLYYMMRVKVFLRRRDFLYPVPLLCGRRVFVACLMIASKYLLDKGLSMDGWCQISGLVAKELSEVELTVLKAMDWKVHVTCEMYEETCCRLRIMLDYARVTRKERANRENPYAWQQAMFPRPAQPVRRTARNRYRNEPTAVELMALLGTTGPSNLPRSPIPAIVANAAPCPPRRSHMEAAVRDARRVQERHRSTMYRRIGGNNAPQVINAALRRSVRAPPSSQHRPQEAVSLPTPENSPVHN